MEGPPTYTMHGNNAEKKCQIYSDTLIYSRVQLTTIPRRIQTDKIIIKNVQKKVLIIRHGDIMFAYKHIDIVYYSLI